jgi:hypothetical protein
MALDFAALQVEVYARGFTALNDAGAGAVRVKRWINEAMWEIDDQEAWPYRMATSTGASPLTISDLGEILSVYDAARDTVLSPDTQAGLLNEWGDLTTAGNASSFYMVAGAITAFPVTTATLTVNYLKTRAEMSADADAPLMPDRYRMAIVHYAVSAALVNKSNFAEAAGARQEGDRIVQRMRENYVLQTGGSRVAVLGYSGDW